MFLAKRKYYVVWQGRKTGIFDNWEECEAQVKGYSGARFQAFSTLQEAERAFYNKEKKDGSIEGIIWDSISVDAGTRGNPGPVEYKGVHTKTGEVLFSYDGIPLGTNNMGEFLAIVHALAYLKQKGDCSTPIYSDSETAIQWVKEKKAKSTLKRTEETEKIWSLVERAEKWLQNNDYNNPILKWQTEKWGEIKADYGRK